MSRFVVVHTSWYQEYINDMKESVKQFSMKEIGQVIKEIYLKSI